MNLLIILAMFAALTVELTFSKRSPKLSWLEPQGSTQVRCQSGDGSSYRGYVSRSKYNSQCLNWNRFGKPWGASKGLGNHNFCRNPDHSSMPWCWVRRGWRVEKEICNIPKCFTTVKPKLDMDTERTCGEKSISRIYRIVGGSFTSIQSQPWVAAIFKQRSRFFCGGTLIAPCWVLTAAHCFNDWDSTKIQHLSVYLGKSAINETDAVNEQKFKVEKVIIHKKFNESNYDNDIALLRIKSRDGGCAARSRSARVVCLPPHLTHLPAGFQCSIAGFGHEKHGSLRYSQILKEAQVNMMSLNDCKRNKDYEEITDNMICAASPDWSNDACQGDSGGPLVCEVSGRMFLFGIVSWGIHCGQKNQPGVYTQVTKYSSWIREKTRLQEFTAGVMYPQK